MFTGEGEMENNVGSIGGIVYTHKQLMALCRPMHLPRVRPVIPEELQKKLRGCRAGAKLRVKRTRQDPVVPAIIG